MRWKIEVPLCFLTLLEIASAGFNYEPSLLCPENCYCNAEFTVCRHNNLIGLPPGLDPYLKSLDLSHNELERIPPQLNDLTELISLNLSHNKISVLGHTDFYRLTNLEHLDLSHNMLSDWMDIRSEVFSQNRRLTFLDFSHNPLRSMPGEKNPLRIKSLEILRLNNCSMTMLNNNIFETLPDLKELHVSENPITVLRTLFSSMTLRFLDLSKCNLRYISPWAFTNLTALETIWLFQNINLKIFYCNSYSLAYLDISDCNLDGVPSGSLPNVYYANFRGNHFRAIPNFSFRNMSNLKYLDLSYNTIRYIEENAFRDLDKVEFIDLSLNTLSNLSWALFFSNLDLQSLNLSYNHFNALEKFASQSLEILDFSSCEINSVDRDSLVDMPRLRSLNLSKNVKLSSLPDHFKGTNLVHLDVSLCRIKSINNRTFESMTSLRQINLAGNRLTTVHPEDFEQVISLDISDNTWRCDCPSLKETYIWLLKTGTRMDNLICESPQMYEGLTWLAACQNEWHLGVTRKDTVWWYTTGLIVSVFIILFVILAMRKMYLLKEKRLREADEARRNEERESLRRMRRIQLEAREEASRNAPDPRELQTPPSYNEALLLPRLDSSHPSLSGSLHSIASKHSLNGSNPDVAKRGRPRRKRRRRKSDSSEGQRASRVVVDSDSPESEQPQPRTTLESDF